MRTLLVSWVFSLVAVTVSGQLKSTKYGLDMMLGDASKEQLISDIRFEDGTDDTVGVVRFDHVGPNLYPLLVSSKLPVPTDSLGLLSFKLHPDTLRKLLWTIDNVNPKLKTRNMDGILVRVTYRIQGRLEQYYVTNQKITTGFFMIIEKRLISNNDKDALDKFYHFVSRTGLLTSDYGKRKWKYMN